MNLLDVIAWIESLMGYSRAIPYQGGGVHDPQMYAEPICTPSRHPVTDARPYPMYDGRYQFVGADSLGNPLYCPDPTNADLSRIQAASCRLRDFDYLSISKRTEPETDHEAEADRLLTDFMAGQAGEGIDEYRGTLAQLLNAAEQIAQMVGGDQGAEILGLVNNLRKDNGLGGGDIDRL